MTKGIINARTTFLDGGTLHDPELQGRCSFRNARHARLRPGRLSRALTVSSDVYFYNLGARFWIQRSKLGDRHAGRGPQLRARRQDRHPAAGEADGPHPRPPSRARFTTRTPTRSPTATGSPGDNINLAIGQGEMVVTPLQLANAYATFANGGTVCAAAGSRSRSLDRNGAVVRQFPRRAARQDRPAPGGPRAHPRRARGAWSPIPRARPTARSPASRSTAPGGGQDRHRPGARQAGHRPVRRLRAGRRTRSTSSPS